MDLSSGMKRKRQEMGDPRSQFVAGSSSGENYEHEEVPQELVMMDEAFSKLKNLLESPLHTIPLTYAENEKFSTFVAHLATSFSHDIYCAQLYNKFFNSVNDGIRDVVIPTLEGTTDEQILLSDLVHMWEKYSIMGAWLIEILEPLNWFYLDNRGVNTQSIYIRTFYDEIGPTLFAKFIDATIQLIHKDMKGDFMHQELLTKVVQFFIDMKEVDDGKELEELESLVLYYFKKRFSRLARWISQKRPVVYLKKVELCLELVETRMSLYFSPATVQKFLEMGRSRLLDRHVFNLIEQVLNF